MKPPISNGRFFGPEPPKEISVEEICPPVQCPECAKEKESKCEFAYVIRKLEITEYKAAQKYFHFPKRNTGIH